MTARNAYWFSALLLLCITIHVSAQPQNNFQYIGIHEGLYQKPVTDVQQDKDGFIWLACCRALQRYDGNFFINFFPFDDADGKPAGEIINMIIDDAQRIWLLTNNNKLGYFDIRTSQFFPIKIKFPSAADAFGESKLFKDNSGKIILLFHMGKAVTCNLQRGEASEATNPFLFPAGWHLMSVFQDRHNNYWLGCIEGLAKYNPGNHTLSTGAGNKEHDPVIAAFANLRTIVNLYIDSRNRFWIHSWPLGGSAVDCYDYRKDSMQHCTAQLLAAIKTYHEITSIQETAGGYIWFAGKDVLVCADPAAKEYYNFAGTPANPRNISFNEVARLFEDREQNIWVATNKGLFHLNPAGQVMKEIVIKSDKYAAPHDIVETSAMCQAANGDLLVSSWGGGLFAYDNNFKPVASPYTKRASTTSENLGWDIVQRKNGDIWWGHQGGWLSIHHAVSNKRDTIYVKESLGKTIRQIAEDSDGNMWLGLQHGGLLKWDHDSNRFDSVQSLHSNILTLLADAHGWLWAGTEKTGLYKINESTGQIVQRYSDENKSLVGNYVPAVIDYDDSTLAGIGGGLFMLNKFTGKINYVDYTTGSQSLVKDKKGNLWMASSEGILSIHPKLKSLLLSYDEQDGLTQFSFNVGAAVLTKAGEIVFGSTTGFVHFNPETVLKMVESYPPIKISGFHVNYHPKSVDSILQLKKLTFSEKQNTLLLRVTSNSFKARYSFVYILEPLNTTWQPMEQNGQLLLNVLPPGKYSLRIGMLTAEQKVVSIIPLSIVIEPPFYKTWWFALILVLLALLILYLLDRQRMKRRDELVGMRRDIGQKLHADINDTLEQINILSEMAVLKNDEEPQKSKAFLGQIKLKSKRMMSAMQDMLWTIAPENDKTEKLIEKMTRYVEVLKTRQDISIDITIGSNVISQRLSMQQRYELLLLFKHSLKALTATGVNDVRIFLGRDRNLILYSIQFSHRASDKQLLNNFFNSKELADKVQAVRGKITSAIHSGTAEIDCTIPL